MNIVIILHDQLSILSILKKKRDTFFEYFWVQADKQTDKQANRQTDIEHGFFEASTQKAPSGQKIANLGEKIKTLSP